MYSFLIWCMIAIGLLASVILLRYIVKSVRAQSLVQKGAASGAVKHSAAVGASADSGHTLPVVDSLLVILSSLLDGQVEVAEAAMRLKVLLDHYDSSLHDDPQFAVFNTLYEALAHMPTHQTRKQTNKKFLHKLDQERLRLEAQYRDDILRSAQVLRDLLLQPK